MNKKTTKELIDTMKGSRNYGQYLRDNQEELDKSYMRIDRALTALLAEKGLKKSAVIAKSGLEIHYGYQIFSGVKTPTRDKVVMLCFGLGLTVDETQQLLKTSGYQQLYGRNLRDNAILFGLTHHLSVIELNTTLYDAGLDILV